MRSQPYIAGYGAQNVKTPHIDALAGRGVPGRELYDHRSDSDEARNLADDPSQAAVVARLSAALRAARVLRGERVSKTYASSDASGDVIGPSRQRDR